MIAATRSELIRIWRPSIIYGGTGIMAGFAAVISIFIYTSLDNPDAASGPVAGSTTADIEQPGGMLEALGSVSSLVGVVLLSVWAIATASDYDTGLIRILVQAQPSRLKLLGGKIAALAIYTAMAAAATMATVVVVARPLSRVFEVDNQTWNTDLATELASGYFNFLVPSLVWGLIGLTIAQLTKSSGIAIAAGISYLLIVESLIGIAAPDATDLLPGGTLAAVTAGGTPNIGYSPALGLSLLYGTIATGAALFLFRQRDIHG